LLASFRQALDELDLISNVVLEEHRLGHGAEEIVAKDPADLCASVLMILLYDHSTHTEVHTDSLTEIEWRTCVLD
jgi:hypothetical protein